MAFVAQSNPRTPAFGFGFLSTPPSSMSVGWSSSSFAQPSSSTSQNGPILSTRVQKRRFENEEDEINRDEPMEPPPQRIIAKRPRLQVSESKHDKSTKDQKQGSDSNDVDVGLLLASLPSQSLLPILNSLLLAHPALKSTILPLIPRPTLPAALKAILQSAEALRDSYPYSQSASSASSSLFSFAPSRTGGFGATPFSSQSNQSMSDSYIASRIRPHVHEFVAVCTSYWPYFSFLAASQLSPSNATAHAAALQAFHRDECYPGDVFTLLAAISNHFLCQPPITQSELAPLLLSRLSQEWSAWVARLDQMVNVEARMFGSEAVNAWANQLDDLAARAQGQVATILRDNRDRWLQQIGWLIGRGPRETRWG